MKPIKLTEEELNQLNTVQARREAAKNELSDIGFLRLKIKRKEEKVETFYNETIEMERKIAKGLETKYGKGSIDIESGTFTPFN